MGSPTEKQIKLVEKITEKLNIDFPICSQEFNTQTFNNFIKHYMKFNSNFTKSDLVTGDIILRRNGNVEIICLQTGTTISPTGFNFLNDLKEDLTSSYNDSGWDTIAVRRPREPHHCQHTIANFVHLNKI